MKKNIISNHKIGITKATKGVIHREGVIDQIHKITTPTLILTGEYDIATTPEKSMRMHKAISGSEIETITGAAHSSTIENPKEVIVHIEEFLNKHVMGTSGTEW